MLTIRTRLAAAMAAVALTLVGGAPGLGPATSFAQPAHVSQTHA